VVHRRRSPPGQVPAKGQGCRASNRSGTSSPDGRELVRPQLPPASDGRGPPVAAERGGAGTTCRRWSCRSPRPSGGSRPPGTCGVGVHAVPRRPARRRRRAASARDRRQVRTRCPGRLLAAVNRHPTLVRGADQLLILGGGQLTGRDCRLPPTGWRRQPGPPPASRAGCSSRDRAGRPRPRPPGPQEREQNAAREPGRSAPSALGPKTHARPATFPPTRSATALPGPGRPRLAPRALSLAAGTRPPTFPIPGAVGLRDRP